MKEHHTKTKMEDFKNLIREVKEEIREEKEKKRPFIESQIRRCIIEFIESETCKEELTKLISNPMLYKSLVKASFDITDLYGKIICLHIDFQTLLKFEFIDIPLCEAGYMKITMPSTYCSSAELWDMTNVYPER